MPSSSTSSTVAVRVVPSPKVTSQSNVVPVFASLPPGQSTAWTVPPWSSMFFLIWSSTEPASMVLSPTDTSQPAVPSAAARSSAGRST